MELIMVPRSVFSWCSLDDTHHDIHSRNGNRYSYFPVRGDGRVLGLYHAERWFDAPPPKAPIADDFQPLSEDIVIGADASIIDFIMQADQHPTNLVVSGSQIAGLVSLSDLQQLPVRSSLFALITSLEMAMALAIDSKWQNSDGWMAYLSDGRRTKLKEAIDDAQVADGFISEIAFAQITDKADIIRKARITSRTGREFERSFKDIRDLRNNLAHANEYAATPEDAKNVCAVVRDIYKLKKELIEVIESSIGE
nr:hypothetical protein [Amylibacter sp.]